MIFHEGSMLVVMWENENSASYKILIKISTDTKLSFSINVLIYSSYLKSINTTVVAIKCSVNQVNENHVWIFLSCKKSQIKQIKIYTVDDWCSNRILSFSSYPNQL